MSRYSFTTGGRRFAYNVIGQGPPVLFIQGVGLHGDGWSPQTDVLAERFQCVTMDNRGTGESGWDGLSLSVPQMADDAASVLEHAGLDSAHVVGHSLGGLIAQQLAIKHRHVVRSLSLLCTFANGKSAGPMSMKMMWLGLRCRFGSAEARRRAFLQMVISPKGMAKNRPDKMAARLKPIFGYDLADPPKVMNAQMKAMRRFDATGQLGKLSNLPTLVASGVFDPIAPPKLGKTLAAAIPGARYVEWGECSHAAPIEHAARVNTAIREHVAAAEAKWKG